MIQFNNLKNTDEEVYNLILEEYERQNEGLEMIASENVPSESVLEAQASYHTLKYAEGYPGKRYYGGCCIIDKTEQLAIDRVCQLFNCKYANVQPHSGASANLAVQFALCKPGDTILGMSLNSGGHLTHGAKPTFSGKNYKAVQYEVNADSYLIDYDALEKLALETMPRLLIAGASAYPREIDFKRLRQIVDRINQAKYDELYATYAKGDYYEDERGEKMSHETAVSRELEKVKSYLMVDMAHIAGLVAAGLHMSPIPYADVVTSTTHKTLRGPRGGIILTDSEDIAMKINKAVFPGTQGGPLENIIAAKAVCFGEALQPKFKEYQEQVVLNAKTLAGALEEYGFNVLTGGTDNHLILLDLRNKGISGQELQERLESIGIISNKNAVPFDTENKMVTSGIRLGTPALTSRGMRQSEMIVIAKIIAQCADDFEKFTNAKIDLSYTVSGLAKTFPLYGN